MTVQRVLELLVGGLVGGLVVATPLLGGSQPLAVSPGDISKLALIESRCPTFSWGLVDGADTFELVVYRLGRDGEEPVPVVRQRVPGLALSWTPPLDLCLERGERYAWTIRALGLEGPPDWSAPSLFQVVAGPSGAEFEEALQVVQRYFATVGRSKPGADSGPEGSMTGPESARRLAPVSAPPPSAVNTTQLTVEGAIEATFITADGSGLTNVTASDLVGAA